ncbi:hypothetical protein EV198_0824 [Roseivirga ehrenbergii]|uniref:Uncharacterized protein n=1 Tax=Roseivirga ehrenbergii (strain DSM 102268 / JCM 13514 / KCTC 12282 / NCIMB 14502 / KMM 6017) TaxID=279360 RepID=A0A150X7G7_ROSEK|nr:hypothetical protein [Roseivirga ehrenbergii]KYG74687.1 hypothetical protein MB14_05640 [Roseivirga ehrenbergii]TCL13990.1 hypothetical protein EV198_0824 [Roseivirga ehrenbergii]
MKKLLVAVILIPLFFCYCENSDEEALVYLMVKNEATLPLDEVTIYLGGYVHTYGTVGSLESSNVRPFKNTYIADSITFKYDSQSAVIKPNNALVQWIGVEMGATYQYVISLDENENFQFSVTQTK